MTSDSSGKELDLSVSKTAEIKMAMSSLLHQNVVEYMMIIVNLLRPRLIQNSSQKSFSSLHSLHLLLIYDSRHTSSQMLLFPMISSSSLSHLHTETGPFLFSLLSICDLFQR